MPYIVQEKRDALEPGIESILDGIRQIESDNPDNDTGGCLNYVITRLLLEVYPVKKYREMAEAVSVLEMAKLEYYRRQVAPYEQQKAMDNGDVYPNELS